MQGRFVPVVVNRKMFDLSSMGILLVNLSIVTALDRNTADHLLGWVLRTKSDLRFLRRFK